MRQITREILLVMFLVMLSFVLHSTVTSSLFSLLPAPFVLSSLLTHITTHPLLYTGVLAAAGELYSHRAPGIMTLIVLTPWLIKRIFGNPHIDVSLRWLGVSAITSAAQLTIVYGHDLVQRLLHDILVFIPWSKVLIIFSLTTLTVYTVSVLFYGRATSDHR